MDEQSIQRKLTAIFSADVVGYSRLMRDDEIATINTLSDTRISERKPLKISTNPSMPIGFFWILKMTPTRKI